jgi:hypothetical protein
VVQGVVVVVQQHEFQQRGETHCVQDPGCYSLLGEYEDGPEHIKRQEPNEYQDERCVLEGVNAAGYR